MYGKIFESMFDGTLTEDWQALITFQQMIILSDADGVVDMTPSAITRRTGIPIEHINAGIVSLELDDPYSRTPDHNGKRIIRLDDHRPWGWFIVNHEKYKLIQNAEDKRQQARNRKRKQREKESQDVTPCHAPSRMSRHTDTDTDTDKRLSDPKGSEGGSKPPPCPHEKIINLYHEILPELQSVIISRWDGQRKKDLSTRWHEDKKHQSIEFWSWFFRVVKANPHWMGENDRAWKADLGWLIKRARFDKVLEFGVDLKKRESTT